MATTRSAGPSTARIAPTKVDKLTLQCVEARHPRPIYLSAVRFYPVSLLENRASGWVVGVPLSRRRRWSILPCDEIWKFSPVLWLRGLCKGGEIFRFDFGELSNYSLYIFLKLIKFTALKQLGTLCTFIQFLSLKSSSSSSLEDLTVVRPKPSPNAASRTPIDDDADDVAPFIRIYTILIINL